MLFTNLYTWLITHLSTQNNLYLPHLGAEARFVWGRYLHKVFSWYIHCPLRNSCFHFFHWHTRNRSRGSTGFLTLKASKCTVGVCSRWNHCCRRQIIAPCSPSTETVNGEKDADKELVTKSGLEYLIRKSAKERELKTNWGRWSSIPFCRINIFEESTKKEEIWNMHSYLALNCQACKKWQETS